MESFTGLRFDVPGRAGGRTSVRSHGAPHAHYAFNTIKSENAGIKASVMNPIIDEVAEAASAFITAANELADNIPRSERHSVLGRISKNLSGLQR